MALAMEVLNRADTDKVDTYSAARQRYCEVKLLPLAYLPTCTLVPFRHSSYCISHSRLHEAKENDSHLTVSELV